ncbi:acetate--CoA ligase family protein [Silicimonas algicola]|uniref:Acyl-CoA synthetase (NDP forming) n=1 Tax=Silicimonas algicola TaxID=1826607 RepID=A0A316GD85_9RHOB|nr:acetate--CoA ligase family protein [Silicimonas algicola]PWK57420.1 acyl-CoA synthetase (NDP forming) [Silicimonas algicola]
MAGLDRLLRPRSIAVIGGGAWCANVIDQCRRIGFSGEIWPVHPTKPEVCGLPTVPAIDLLPGIPDAAFVGINRQDTVVAVRALAALGAGGAVCFASGFREAEAETGDGATLQDELLAAAGDMTILGPNCYGFLNYLDGAALWPDQHGGVRVESGVALVTQSSNIAINLTMQDRGLPLAYVVTAGNQAQTGVSSIARALIRDERVTALGLHVEGFDDLRGVEALAGEARDLGKPVVVLKVGRSDQARAATVSHTASLAGSDAGAEALLARLGFGRARSLPVLLETLKLLHVAGPLPSNRIASMSCSGGEASLVADTAQGTGLAFPPLDATQAAGLRTALGPKVALANPLDYHTYIWGDEAALSACFTAMMQGDLGMGMVVLDFPRLERCDASAWEPVIAAVARAKTTTGKPMAIVASLKETMPEAYAIRLMASGIVPFCGLDEAIAAMSIAATLGQTRGDAVPLLMPPPAAPGVVLDEVEAKARLAKHGLHVPASDLADTAEAAAEAATRLGFPVVLKGRGIAHKTEAGAVAVALTDAKAVLDAATAMPASGFLVERMVTDGVAELLVGVVSDPAHGYVLTLAAGGTLAELIDDRTSLLVPASRASVCAALDRLRMAPLLHGFRGRPAADIDAVLDAVMAVQSYVEAARPQEVEINPLICGPSCAVAADALIRTED